MKGYFPLQGSNIDFVTFFLLQSGNLNDITYNGVKCSQYSFAKSRVLFNHTI